MGKSTPGKTESGKIGDKYGRRMGGFGWRLLKQKVRGWDTEDLCGRNRVMRCLLPCPPSKNVREKHGRYIRTFDDALVKVEGPGHEVPFLIPSSQNAREKHGKNEAISGEALIGVEGTSPEFSFDLSGFPFVTSRPSRIALSARGTFSIVRLSRVVLNALFHC